MNNAMLERGAGLLLAGMVWVCILAGPTLARGATSRTQRDSPELLFGRGVEAYRGGDLDSAEGFWRRALESGADPEVELDRATLCYNLGSVAYRRERFLEAAAWYRACLRLEPRHRDARANLEMALGAADLEPDDRGDLASTLRRLLGAPSVGEAEVLALSGTALLVVALLLEALRGGVVLRRLRWFALGAWIVSALPWWVAVTERAEDPVMVVAEGGVALRSEPRPDATSLDHLGEGVSVERIDGLPGWIRVEVEGADAPGWIPEHAGFALNR